MRQLLTRIDDFYRKHLEWILLAFAIIAYTALYLKGWL